MTDPIRWGVVGASNFAQTTMARAIHLAKLATSNPAKAKGFTDFAPDLRVEDTYDSLLSAEDIDAIYVPLPNHLHVEWVIRALKAGKHVLCEKPIAMQESDFDAMIEARDAAGKLAAEAFMIVHHPQWQRARALLSDGAIGRLRHVESVFSYNNPDPSNVRNRSGMGGGGLRDIGVYTFGAARFATGEEPEEMSAIAEFEQDFDVYAEVRARFPSFTFHSLISTRIAPRQRVVFHGEGGTIELTAPFNAGTFDQAELIVETSATARTVERWPGVNQYVRQVEAFVQSVQAGDTYLWTLENAKGTQAMIDSAIRLGREHANR